MIITVKYCNFPHHFLMLHVICTYGFVHWATTPHKYTIITKETYINYLLLSCLTMCKKRFMNVRTPQDNCKLDCMLTSAIDGITHVIKLMYLKLNVHNKINGTFYGP